MSKKNEAVRLFSAGWAKRAIARSLGVDPKTVRRWLEKINEPVVELTDKEVDELIEVQKGHALQRASILKESLVNAVTSSMWPVVNFNAIVVEPRVDRVYSYTSGEINEQARSPRTYVTDVLRAKPITDPRGKIFIFTRAQNATPVHTGLLRNIEAYAKHRGASIVIGPDTYETAWWHETNADCRNYDINIQKYLCYGRMDIGPNFFFAGEMNIMTTASAPIADLASYSMGKWCVVPHSKQNLVAVPSTDPGSMAHQVLSTGSITIPKIIPKKAGVKSIFHHIMGFVIAEFDEEGNVFCRHVNAEDDGSFYDLWLRVEDGKVKNAPGVEYIMPGDVHRAKLDRANPKDVLATFGFLPETTERKKDSIIDLLKPKRVILQDLHDGEVDDHHTANDLGHKVELAARGRNMLETEIVGDALFLAQLESTHKDLEEIIVDESNHDLRLERYVREGRYRNDGFNARLGLQLEDRYLEYREQVAHDLDAGKEPAKFSLYEYAVRKMTDVELKKTSWVYDGESRVINEVEVGHHGFRGTNGSKASHTGYVRLGRKISYGDKHNPSIRDGAFGAGAMALRHGYNKGPSSWCVSHIVQYMNGKRCIITVYDGKFCYMKR